MPDTSSDCEQQKIMALTCLKGYPKKTHLSEVYDEDEELRMAMATLVPDFEYPDWSHLPFQRILAKVSAGATAKPTKTHHHTIH